MSNADSSYGEQLEQQRASLSEVAKGKSLTLRQRWRWILAIASAVVLAIVLSYAVYNYLYPYFPENIIDDKPLNELTKAGIELKLEQSRSLFQLALLSVGTLWGLLLAKKDEAGIVLADHPEICMFVCASFLLMLSLICHTFYLQKITNVYSLAGQLYEKEAPSIPDVFGPNINYLFVSQCWFLVSGVTVALLTFISAHKLKEK
ncbi:MAG: hypothetical protein H0U81_08115 [Pyrinomonadaceae bacterium]|nr:hypothetical protein [Pyrinomonadaceae bacterium]